MSKVIKSLKITFAPGCFDDFEGTQEELDALVEKINSLSVDDILSQATPIDYDEDLFDGDVFEFNTTSSNRKLH